MSYSNIFSKSCRSCLRVGVSLIIQKRQLSNSLFNYYAWNFKKEKKPVCADESPPKLLNIDEKNQIPPNWISPKIVIVGAGMAGLSAAHRLVQCGMCNFTILEASDRPGGRIHSSWIADCVAELGAMWINGASNANSVYSLACIEGLLKPPLPRQYPSKGIFYTLGGRTLDTSIVNKAYATFCQIESEASAMYTSNEYGDSVSLGKFIEERVNKEVSNFPEMYRSDAKLVLFGYMNALKVKLGEDLNSVNACLYGSTTVPPGGNIRIPLGFGGVLAPLLRDLPDCSIHYCKRAQLIRWGTASKDAPRAVVVCCDGCEYPADYVILTVPLGVLKLHVNDFFCPELPAKKVEAIKNLGFGHVNKLYLYFKDPMWASDDGDVYFAFSPSDVKYRNDWTKGLSSLVRVPDSEQVLYGVVGGKDAIEMEKKSDEEILSDVKNLMCYYTGNPAFPMATSVLRSSWSTNVFFNGAFTYLGLDSCLGNLRDLAEPVPEACDDVASIIFFAGEHTCCKSFATVQGARDSGIREAERIISFTRKFKGPPTNARCPPCDNNQS